jgi:hypothetical protein
MIYLESRSNLLVNSSGRILIIVSITKGTYEDTNLMTRIICHKGAKAQRK